MTESISTLVKSVFQKESLHDCSVEELQTITNQYPYFSPAQFLLAEKLKSSDENLYKDQMQKLSLYFNNPVWLDYLVNGYKAEIVVEPEEENFDNSHETIEEKNEAEPTKKETPTDFESQPGIVESTDEGGADVHINDINSFEEVTMERDQHQDVSEESTLDIETADEKIDEPVTDILNEPITEEKPENVEAPIEEISADIESRAETTESSKEEIEPNVSIPQLPDLKQEATETELTFEPYHTVDYFASQGIKFVPEEKPADRFGQQLKSFTEWLKAMKRLPTETPRPLDAISEEKVLQLADHSISEGEVVTEAMAEVWLKQGNKEKAIETYNKLSLLNPAKSAYFASLIEQLKNS